MGRHLFHPEIFQGNLKKRSYFEGWYFKHTCSGEVLAVIPGISLVQRDDRHAFIQIISSKGSCYIPYDISEFQTEKHRFFVRIGDNYFSRSEMTLSIDREEIQIAGTIAYKGTTPYPVTLTSPGIMGWYGYVPFMECFHGVVSMNHSLQGSMTIGGAPVDFTGGKGYIEKDWGTSFPKDYLWMQSNDFADPRTSFMLSVASIPWLGRQFVGFLGFLYTGERLYRFATYTRSQIEELAVSGHAVSLRIADSRYVLWISVQNAATGLLAAPRKGVMNRYIKEGVSAKIRLTLKDNQGSMLFDGTGDPGACEISGDVEKLL